jgi:hypothetical protein
MITDQWKEIEAWKYRYMFFSEKQLQTRKFLLGEIRKKIAHHSDMVQRERKDSNERHRKPSRLVSVWYETSISCIPQQ